MLKNIDIFDKNNLFTGRQVSIDEAMRRGLWHRGVHLTVVTLDGKVLVQKRSCSMLIQPGLLDISCGGVVDAGEKPEQSAVRELYEEVGIKSPATSLKFYGTYRLNHAFPRIRRFGRATVYCYILVLPSETELSVQRQEVEWARFVPFREARRLVRLHYIRGLGRLAPRYRMYQTQLKVAERLIEQTIKH